MIVARIIDAFDDLRPDRNLLAQRGIVVSYETVRRWCNKFGPGYANRLRRQAGQCGDTSFVDEVFERIGGDRHYFYRAVDQDGDSLDILVQKRRNKTGFRQNTV